MLKACFNRWGLRRPVCAATFAAALLLLGGPNGAAKAGPLMVDYSLPPPSLDPVVVCDIADNGVISNLYVTLLRYESKPLDEAPRGISVMVEDQTRLTGYLAESWSVSEDGRVLTFKIRDGVKFPSGRKVDANAVRASLQRNLDSGTCGRYYLEAAQFGNTESITAPDDHTVVITLKRPEPLVLQALTKANTGIVDIDLVKQNGGDVWLASHAAGFGPYLLKEYQPGVRAVFQENPNFFGEKPLEHEVVVNFITDSTTLLLRARSHQADITLGLPKAMVASLTPADGLTVIKVPTARWQLIALPNQQPPFDNPTFREALTYAVPYEAIQKNVAHGFGELFYGPFPPQFPAFTSKYGAPRGYDAAKAKQLIEESGVKMPVTADLIIREGQNDQEQIAAIVQGTWRPIGLNVTIHKLPASGYQEEVAAKHKAAMLIRFDGPSVTDPAWLLDYDMRCASLYNTSNYCNKSAEALLDEAHPLRDPAKRQVHWDKIAEIWTADSPRIPVYADIYTAVVSSDIKHWTYAQDGPFDLYRWGR
jgi:peptide/nickel transport system substrate-binding protein